MILLVWPANVQTTTPSRGCSLELMVGMLFLSETHSRTLLMALRMVTGLQIFLSVGYLGIGIDKNDGHKEGKAGGWCNHCMNFTLTKYVCTLTKK